ncbi:hypothetical protein PIB30_005173 [Stylosanthes scabra]|uniref:Uncharacterized protein n=1 Tax=Stylosanthes scabra TaxID=79078 RepID=A0ABU6R5A4_9FABA|nr:hypothetical protein [Stylosanthes scabra]
MGGSCKLDVTRTHGVGINCDDNFIISIKDNVSGTIYNKVFDVPTIKGFSYYLTSSAETDFGHRNNYYPPPLKGGLTIWREVHFYGDSCKRKGLVSVERLWNVPPKRSLPGRKPHQTTLTHFLASSTPEFKGPFQHPASALLHMFDEFKRNKYEANLPPMCLHCEPFLSSQNEESHDSTASSKLEQIIERSFLNNTGNIQGDGNGNIVIRNLLYNV